MVRNLYIADKLEEELEGCLINDHINPDAGITDIKVSITRKGIESTYPLKVNDTLIKALVVGLDAYIRAL